jgi:hypothetical protein
MDAWGINLQYLLLQFISFVGLFVISTAIGFGFFLALRAFRPGFLSQNITVLSKTDDGLNIPNEHLPTSNSFHINKFGNSLLVLPKDE